ncbi:MAG: hypothetical protein KAX10_02905 [Candidatus Lokiarchaeota archaeon]|nr:hypothetical protein [Candidatus Lokiarchaeota archaeon]
MAKFHFIGSQYIHFLLFLYAKHPANEKKGKKGRTSVEGLHDIAILSWFF